MTDKNETLALSFISYLLIATITFLYIHFKIGIGVLFALNSKTHQPLSNAEFNIVNFILVTGIGASICLLFLLGIVFNHQELGQPVEFFKFVDSAMQIRDIHKERLAGIIFSDYTRRPHGVGEALRLQAKALMHAAIKIIVIPFNIGLLHPILMTIFGLLFILPIFIFDRPLPVYWSAVYFFFYFYFCYRGLLSQVAKWKGISRTGNMMVTGHGANPVAIRLFISSHSADRVTLERITEILEKKMCSG